MKALVTYFKSQRRATFSQEVCIGSLRQENDKGVFYVPNFTYGQPFKADQVHDFALMWREISQRPIAFEGEPDEEPDAGGLDTPAF